MRSRAALVTAGAVALLLAPMRALAQEPPSPAPPSRHVFEYWFGPTAVASGFDGTISTDYATSLESSQSQGRTTQMLTVHSPWHLGVEGGIGLFPSRHAGLQVRLDYTSRGLSGTSGPVDAVLGYTAARPPDFILRQYEASTTTAWQAPTGTSTELTLGFEGAVRWDAGSRVSGAASAGLVYFRAKGTAESVAYTSYALGSDAVLVSSNYAMTLAYGPATALGFDVGGGVAVKVAGPVDVMADVRYFHAATISPEVRVAGFAGSSQTPGAPGLAEVSSRMSPIEARFDPSFFRIFIGVRVRS